MLGRTLNADLGALPTSSAPIPSIPVDSRCILGVLYPHEDRRTVRKGDGMIPEYLTTTEAQRLLDRGRARLDGPECLITKRAVYHWQPETQRYARDNAPPVAQVDPTPVATHPYPPSWGWRRPR